MSHFLLRTARREPTDLTHVGPVRGRGGHAVAAALGRAVRSSARGVRAALAFVRTLGLGDGVVVVTARRDLEWLSLTRKECDDLPSDVEWVGLSYFGDPPPPVEGGEDPSRIRLM